MFEYLDETCPGRGEEGEGGGGEGRGRGGEGEGRGGNEATSLSLNHSQQ